MVEVNISRPDGSVIYSLLFPGNVGEARLDQYIDFVVARREAEKNDENPLVGVAQAVSAFFKVDVLKVLEAEVGEGKVTDGQLEQTVGGLFMALDAMLSEYKPKISDDCDFTWDGVLYQLPRLTMNAVTGQLQKTALNVLEYVEADEARRLARELAAKDGDVDGSIWWSEYTRLIAITVRKPGEILPHNKLEREQFLAARAETFKHIPLDIALDVDFFLTRGLANLKPAPTIIGSLILPLFLIVEQHRKRLRPTPTQLERPKAKRVTLSNGRVYGGSTAN